jgi:hypothetical protein
MKRLLILILVLVVGASCRSQMSSVDVSQQKPNRETPTPQTEDRPNVLTHDTREVPPAAFRAFDFGNLTYQVSLNSKSIRLKDGKYEYANKGSLGGNSYKLESVDAADLDGDGKLEAVVRLLQVSCGGSCDGGSHLFYFYSNKGGRLTLLSRIETGSLGYQECGLKSFLLQAKALTLETFQVCRFDGTSLKPTADAHPNPDAKVGKFTADKFTRFDLLFKESRFVLKGRKVLPYPQEDISNYAATITIGND